MNGRMNECMRDRKRETKDGQNEPRISAWMIHTESAERLKNE